MDGKLTYFMHAFFTTLAILPNIVWLKIFSFSFFIPLFSKEFSSSTHANVTLYRHTFGSVMLSRIVLI